LYAAGRASQRFTPLEHPLIRLGAARRSTFSHKQGEKEKAHRASQRAFVILGLDPRIHAVTIAIGRNGAEF